MSSPLPKAYAGGGTFPEKAMEGCEKKLSHFISKPLFS
jgi:hypothetical protein